MNVGDKVFVINWMEIYSTFFTWVDSEKVPIFGWKTEMPSFCGTEYHWKYEYEPNLTLKGTVNKREPRKLVRKLPVYKDYKYEIMEMMQHPADPDRTVCLIASTHTDQEWNRCYVQIGVEGLSYLTPEQFADNEFNVLKEYHKGKYSINNYKEFPKELMEKVYDTDDNVLFGSHYTKGKVTYSYIPGFYTVDGIPFIVNSSIDYDGKGNSDLPEGVIIMAFSDLHKMFPNNKFGR